MKAFILIASALLTLNAQARSLDGIYLRNTELPYGLRAPVVEKIDEVCNKGGAIVLIEEHYTTVKEERFDSTMVEYHYETTFEVRHLFDGTHMDLAYIKVKSVLFDSNIGEVKSVSSDAHLCE